MLLSETKALFRAMGQPLVPGLEIENICLHIRTDTEPGNRHWDIVIIGAKNRGNEKITGLLGRTQLEASSCN